MERSNHVVVGVDGTELSTLLTRWAAAEAETRHVPLELLALWDVPLSPSFEVAYPIEPGPYQEAAEAAAEQARAAVPAGVDVVVSVEQDTARHGLDTATERASLVVVGTHGHGAIEGALLGSVSHHLLHHARCPVLLVPEGSPEPPPARVVVGYDGSEIGDAAVRAAADLCARHDAGLDVVTGCKEWHWAVAATEDWMRDQVTELLVGPVTGDVPFTCTATLDGPASTLLEWDADLVVVGSTGLGGIRHVLLGSTSRRVAYHARVPTLVVSNR